MSRIVIEGVLGADVANAGTFTAAFPAGYSRGDFVGGVAHALVLGNSAFTSPVGFTVAFTTLATVTNASGATWGAGTPFYLELDVAGETVVGLKRTAAIQTLRASLGSPVATDDDALRAVAALATTGSFALITAGKTFDVPRNVIVTSAGNDAGVTFTVTGEDEYGAVVVEAITGANAGVAAGKKAFKKITSIANSVAAAGTVKVGFGNVLGLPVFLPYAQAIIVQLQDDANAAAGTTVIGLAGGTASTAITADVRGTYVPNAAPDGSKAYALIVSLTNPLFRGNAQFAG